MKFLRFLPILLLILTLFVSCQSQIKENDLVGTWKVVEFNADMPDISPILIQETNEIALSSVYTFNKDNSMLRKSNIEPNGESGKFELLDANKRIIMTYDTEGYNSIEKYNIVSLKGKTMKWEFNDGVLGNLVMKLKKK